MPAYTAADVKKLRDLTDAPMMECKNALEEAGGDFEKAQEILREKGKAAASKRADRSTAAGVVAFATDGGTVAGVVVECETDFVARNEEFIALVQDIANAFLANEPGDAPLDAQSADGTTVGRMIEAAVAKIRENIRLAKVVRLSGDEAKGTYVHHDLTKGAVVAVTGGHSGAAEVAKTLAVQVVALDAQVVRKEDLSQDVLEHEIALETQRAINEGKTPEMAANIARGRVNKEYVKSVVLLEQVFYKDQKISVGDYVKQEGGGATVTRFERLAVGAN